MLAFLRNRSASTVIALCIALSAVWVSGAHAHRHVSLGHTESAHEHATPTAHDDHEAEYQAALGEVDEYAFEHDRWNANHALSSDTHQDVELVGVGASTVKTLGIDQLAVALLIVSFLPHQRLRSIVIAAPQAPPGRLLEPIHLRPPLRGPPSFSVV